MLQFETKGLIHLSVWFGYFNALEAHLEKEIFQKKNS